MLIKKCYVITALLCSAYAFSMNPEMAFTAASDEGKQACREASIERYLKEKAQEEAVAKKAQEASSSSDGQTKS